MDTKLTIRLDSNVIENAKSYARSHNISLSRMIESYLSSVTQQNSNKLDITTLVESLSGVAQCDDDKNIKQEYSDYLADKYR